MKITRAFFVSTSCSDSCIAGLAPCHSAALHAAIFPWKGDEATSAHRPTDQRANEHQLAILGVDADVARLPILQLKLVTRENSNRP